jgi:predicted Rdx family selenoprotein
MRLGWPVLGLLLVPLAVAGRAQSGTEQGVAALLAKVGASVERYYAKAQSVMCTETVSLQTLGYDLIADAGMLRRLVYDLRVAWSPREDGGVPEARVERELVRVNSRPPRPKDKPNCTDPTPVSPDSLEMLLPAKQGDYVFSLAGATRINGRQAMMVDFRARQPGPVAVRAHEGREDCYQVDMPGRTRGRVWIDRDTADVLRLDERLIGFVDVRVPAADRRTKQPLDVTFERLDSSTIFRPVTFSDPEETLMLPSSADSLTVIRNSGVPRQRTSQRFTNYQRFTTEGRIVDDVQ